MITAVQWDTDRHGKNLSTFTSSRCQALTPHKAHSGDHGDHGDDHGDHGAAELDAVLKGLVALAALLFFFVAERAIGILHGTCTRGKTKVGGALRWWETM